MNRDERREAEKDLLKYDKQSLLMLNYQLLELLQNNKIKEEEYIEHRDLIKRVWERKFGTEILLEDIITSND